MKESFVVGEIELEELAKDVLATLSKDKRDGAKVILLEGDLGAGKTTFTKLLGRTLGVREDDIHSPTFILRKDYETPHHTFKKLIHIDAYRFENKSEADILKLEDELGKSDSLVVIEWPSKMEYESGDFRLVFSHVDDTTREIEVEYIPYEK